MSGKNENDINDVLGKLRASVDKTEKSSKKPSKSDVFDREIAALIQKQLNTRESAGGVANDAEPQEEGSSPFYSDEIRLEDFVIENDASKGIENESIPETVVEPIEPTSEDIPEELPREPAEEVFGDADEPVVDEIVEEMVDGITDEITDGDLPVEQQEMPPAVMQALEDAFSASETAEPDEPIDFFDESEEIEPVEIIEDEPEEIEPTDVIEDEREDIEPVETIDDESEAPEPLDTVDDIDVAPRIRTLEELEIPEQLDILDDAELNDGLEAESADEPQGSIELSELESETSEVVETLQLVEQSTPEDTNEAELETVAQETETAEPAPEQISEPEKTEPSPVLPGAWAYRGAEYRSHEQDAQINVDYNKCRAIAVIKLIVGVILCGLCGFMENVGYFGFLLIRPFEPTENPVIYATTLTVLLVCCALLCLRQLKDGIVSVFAFEPEPHAITFFAVAVSFIYNIVMLIIRPEHMMLYNFPATLCIVMTLVGELLSICREKNSFDVVSCESVRYSPERETKAFEEKYNARAIRAGAEPRRVYNMVTTRFSGGYFKYTNQKKKGIYILNFMLLPLLAVGFVEFVIALSTRQAVSVALGAFTATVLIALPAPLLISLVLPPLMSSLRLKKRGSAVLGDGSVDEFAHPKLLVFEDRDMFPAERIGTKGLKLYDGFELYDVLIKTGSLFAHIGGPLGELFEAENSKYHRIRDVKLVKVERGGVEAVLDGNVNILAGNIDFIEKYGIYPKRVPKDEQLIAEGEVSVIYIVIDSRPAARLYADYRTDELFEKRISELCRSQGAAAIRTSDPGIDETMISRKRTVSEYELAVIRPGFAREGEERESFEAGIVSLGDPCGVVDAVNECHKLKKSRRAGMMLYFFVFLANIIVSTLLVVFKLIPYIASGLVVLYMLLWLLPIVFLPGVFDTSKK